MLIQIMALCFALALTSLLYCGSYPVERLREYISLSLSGICVDGFIMQAPEVLAHLYVSGLILLINTSGIL